MSKTLQWIGWLVIAVIVIILAVYFVRRAGTPNNTPTPGASTTVVSTSTPSETASPTGSRYTDPVTGVSFLYPATLGTTYIRPVDWPPAVQVLNGTQSCTEAGSATAPAGQTQSETINGHTYCVTTETQGAAGSLYTSYAYAFPMTDPTSGAEKTIILSFSLQKPQCVNYDEPRRSACTTEEASFDINPVVDSIAGSLSLAS